MAVEDVFGAEPEKEVRYSPAKYLGAEKHVLQGNPDTKQISTSYVERQNITMLMNMRRFTRLTDAFSKKVGNLGYALALHYMYYNFARVHKTLGMTLAMAAGIADHVWTMEDIVELENNS